MIAKQFPLASLLSLGVYMLACNSPIEKPQDVLLTDNDRQPATDTMIAIGDTIQADEVASWNNFLDYAGKYAVESGLFNEEPLKTRTATLLGKAKRSFFERLKVSPPIEIENRILFNEGYVPGKSGYDEAAVAVDLERDIIYIGFTVNKNLMLFSERGDTDYPEKFLHWMRKFDK